jgi:hypothetical protein
MICLPTVAMMLTAAWRPILDPLPLQSYWLALLLPLAVAIAVAYKTLKLPDLRHLPRQAAQLTVLIVVFMIIAAVALWLITEAA